ncbi:helix-turn-helix domain-containing protein [Exiguobacterium sp.]|uniref:helix-turn-helix domain-containing protein n=1 Tax=Exiguobacterium sp. TaxID=44751 RepID=UPI0028AB1965|nr:helix-turn-helix domain-containing protein [Exiguobacterium sp.]
MKEVLVVTLTIDELRGIVQEEVQAALKKSALKVWYSEAEAQAYTGYSKRTLYNARIDKSLKASTLNRHVRYHRDDLDTWMRSKQN